MTRFRVRDANKRRDGHALLGFRCWIGEATIAPDDESEDEDEEAAGNEQWVREVEEYVQLHALKTAHRVLVFETDEGELAGVSAFDRQNVVLAGRRRDPAWRLHVVALSPVWRGKWVEADIPGCPEVMKASEYVLRATFRRMLEIDDRRNIVVATIHDENRASIVACARVGLDRTARENDQYWAMLGEVDPRAGQPRL